MINIFKKTGAFLIDLTALPALFLGYYIELYKDGYKLGKSIYNRNK